MIIHATQTEATLGAMKTDKGQFDEVPSQMLAKPPQKTSEIEARPKARARPKDLAKGPMV